MKVSSFPYKRMAEDNLPMHVGQGGPNKQIKLSSLAGAISLMVFGRVMLLKTVNFYQTACTKLLGSVLPSEAQT